MNHESQAEHRWLQRILGEWRMESECPSGPDKPAEKMTGTEKVRALGGLWVVGEGQGDMPGGGQMRTMITLGFDPAKSRFVGSFVCSIMPMLWIYEGKLEGNTLTLDCEGPDFANPGKTTSYKDIIELRSDDHRVLTSRMLGPDGAWHEVMQAHYHRTA